MVPQCLSPATLDTQLVKRNRLVVPLPGVSKALFQHVIKVKKTTCYSILFFKIKTLLRLDYLNELDKSTNTWGGFTLKLSTSTVTSVV